MGEDDRNLPKKLSTLPEGTGKIVKVACGYGHTILIDNKNQTYVFGNNGCGQLGLGDEDNRNLPEKFSTLPEGAGKISKIACGGAHTILIDNKHQTYVFGYNKYGQLGLGDEYKRNLPKK